jgi:transcriptional regulator with XRE-family HTH domain
LAEQEELAVQVGQRLRAVRRAAGMSPKDVQDASNGEFKPSTLLSYEEGVRRVSLARLSRLAQFYKVPVSEFVPGTIAVGQLSGASRPRRPDDLVVDMAALDRTKGERALRLRNFCRLIVNQRGAGPSDGLLHLRRSDQAAVAAALGVESDEVVTALDDLAGSTGARRGRPKDG